MIVLMLACAPAALVPVAVDPAHDFDADGFDERAGDCDDRESAAFPGGVEVCGDGVDQDCSGADAACDDDGDGFSEDDGDCDDADRLAFPGATEVCGDGVDQDCDGGRDPACTLAGEVTPDPAQDALVEAPAARLSPTVDHDGDGRPDIVIATDGAARVYRWEDGPVVQATLLATLGADAVVVAAAAGVGGACGSEGDVAVGVPDWPGITRHGAVALFAGPVSGTVDLDDADCLVEGSLDDGLGAAVADAGRFDADPFDDLVVGAPDTLGGGLVHVVYGPVSPLLLVGGVTFRDDQALGLGVAAAGGSDLDGDGRDDLVVASWGSAGAGGARVFVVPGADERYGTAELEDAADHAEATAGLAPDDPPALAARADLDGDGTADLVVGIPAEVPDGADPLDRTGAVYVLAGNVGSWRGAALADVARATFEGNAVGGGLGAAVDAAGDLDGDGRPEVVAGAPGEGNGYAYLLAGPFEGTVGLGEPGAWFGRIVGPEAGSALGTSVLGPGDLDGDGAVDVAASATEGVWLLLGGAY